MITKPKQDRRRPDWRRSVGSLDCKRRIWRFRPRFGAAQSGQSGPTTKKRGACNWKAAECLTGDSCHQSLSPGQL